MIKTKSLYLLYFIPYILPLYIMSFSFRNSDNSQLENIFFKKKHLTDF